MCETLFGEREFPCCERGVADDFPAVLNVCCSGNVKGDREVVEGEGEVETVFWVCGDVEGHVLVTLALEEAGDFVFLVVRDICQELGGGVHVAAEDEGLVFHYREGEGVGNDIDVFVRDIRFTIARQVAEEIHGLVEVRNGVGLIADEVVEAVGAVGVDKAVADPLAGADRFVNIGDHFESRFDAVIFDLAGVESGDVVFAGEAEDIEGFFAGEGDQLATFGPVDLHQRK